MPSPADVIQPGYDPYSDVAGDTGWFGSSIVNAVAKASTAVVNTVAKAVKKAAPIVVPIAQEALKKTGPWGHVASGALGAMNAGIIEGKNPKGIAMAAAKGALPAEAMKAISAADAIRRGEPLLKVALANAHSVFQPGTDERLGFMSAVRALNAGAGRPELGTMRRAIQSEGGRRAFDAAIGVVADQVDRGNVKRRSPIGRDRMGSLRPRSRSLHPELDVARRKIQRNPGLSGLPVGVLARKLGVSSQTVQHALGGARMFYWRPLPAAAAAFVKRRAVSAPIFSLVGDVGALDASGTVYIVESGDFPSKIAQKLTGSAGRWPELIKANPKKPTVKTGSNKGSFTTLFAGERLTLPASWVTASALPSPVPPSFPTIPSVVLAPPAAPGAPPSPLPGGALRQYRVVSGDTMQRISVKFTGQAERWRELLSVNPQKRNNPDRLAVGEILAIPADWPLRPGETAPPPVLSIPSPPLEPPPPAQAQNAAAMLQAKAILVAWARSDGVGRPGVDPNYGSTFEDTLTPAWTARDRVHGSSFESFSNAFRGTRLTVDGEPNNELFESLRAWAEAKAQGIPQGAPPAGPPAGIPPIGVPPVQIPPGFPPVTLPPVQVPGLPQASTPAQTAPAEKSSGGGIAFAAAAAAGLYLLSEVA